MPFGVAGAACAFAVTFGAAGGGWFIVPLAASLGAFLVGLVLWSRRATSRWRSTLIGALTGGLAHPVAWYLAILWNWATGSTSSLGEAPLDPIDGLWGCLVLSAWSLLLVGWITVPAGALVGFAIAHVSTKSKETGPIDRT